MRKHPSLWTCLALAALMLAVGTGAASANSIAVPNGGSGTCASGNANTARFAGNCGALVSITGGDPTPAYVQENNPSAETAYRVRLYVNLQTLTMADGDSFDLFTAYDGADPVPPATTGNAIITLSVGQTSGIKRLTASLRTDGGGSVASTSAKLIDGYRSIEFEFLRATAPAANNGYLKIWVDGFACTGPDPGNGSGTGACDDIEAVDNDGLSINYARWGGVNGIDAGTSGTFRMDDFASQRSGYMGPAVPLPTDTPTSNGNWREIQGLYSAGITSGCSIGSYCPGNNISRAQMAVFVVRAMHGANFTPPPATNQFPDVTDPFTEPFIEQFAADGISSGCGGGNFCPTAGVTRRQMAVFLLRAEHGSGYTPPPATGTVFGDVTAGSQFAAFIEQLAAEGITLGCGGGNYCPETVVTRAQMALFLIRTYACPTGPAGLIANGRCMPRPQIGP